MKIKRGNTKKHFLAFSLLLAIFSFFSVARAETEFIQNFSANITIQKDGSIFVIENIVYDFGTNQKHGIFREIPLTATDGPQLDISVLGVSNEVGHPYQYTTSVTNNILRIKIGDPNVVVSGAKTYIISYKVYNAIRTFSDHDELYWNVTGNQWPVFIQNASASVTLPDSNVVNAKMDCFTGSQGSTQKNCSFVQSGADISYSTTQLLNASEGLTIVLGIPLGYIQYTYTFPLQTYSTTSNSLLKNYATTNLADNFSLFFLSIFFASFILTIISIFRKRAQMIKPHPVIPKELKGRPVTVEYNPPNDLSPIEVGTLLDRRVDITDVSSVIMDLAVRSYLKIRYLFQETKFFPDKKDFEFIKIKDGADLTHPADKVIFELLFSSRDNVKLSELKEKKTTFQLYVKKIQEDIEQRLYDEEYFDQLAKNKSKKIEKYLSFAIVALFIGFFISTIFPTRFSSIFIILIFGTVVALSIKKTQLNHKLTPQGIVALEKILGFKEFLQLTEKDKLQLLNAPDLQPEIFEKFLPYAMVFGVEDKWAQKFEGIYNKVPNWYEDSTATSFNSYALARNLNLFNSSFNQVFNNTSSKSSSGFGGRGHSGGGSGGGGGGSW